MKPALRVMLCDDAGERFFGEGPCRLLHLIEETGSLRSAAAQMGLSYSKALRLVQHAEKELGFALTCKTIGGRGGGGSTLTPTGCPWPFWPTGRERACTAAAATTWARPSCCCGWPPR